MIYAIGLVMLHAGIDWFLITKLKREINHPIETALFIAVSIAMSMLMHSWAIGVLALPARFLLFDYLLNIFRKKDWDYFGTSAWTDKILRKIGNKWIILGLRGFVFALACYLYY